MIPVLKNESEILNVMRKNIVPCAKDFICFFSSHLNAFITDPLFMNIPLEDKIVHRGYAVFETTKIFGNKIYQLDKHIDRFLNSIKKIDLKSQYSKEEYRSILLQLASVARKEETNSDIDLRYFYTAGLGNFSVVVNENLNSFYAVAYRADNTVRPTQGTEDKTVYVDEIRKNILTSKNTNYLVHSLVTKKSRENGGYLGIMVDSFGHILESPISNLAFVFHNGDFNVPPFDKTLIGTTVVRCLEFVENELIPNGIIKSINRDYLNVLNISEYVKEAMFVGGDFVIPILKIDNITLSSGPGEVTKMLQKFLTEDKKDDDVAEEIPEFIDL